MFKIGRYYRHSGGKLLHVLAEGNGSYWWADPLLAETGESNLQPVGRDADSAVGYTEITEDEWAAGIPGGLPAPLSEPDQQAPKSTGASE